jgi:YidC/Oxa1 family membrane protein insertase
VSERKELSTETRSLIAIVLCLMVIGLWSLIYKPPQPSPTKSSPVTTAPASATPVGSLPAPLQPSTKPAPIVAMHAAGEERSIVIESDLYRVQISNRGAVVRSWQLTKFTDDHVPSRTLDLVHADAAQQEGGWPFSLALDDPQQESAVNNALFEIKSAGSVSEAGAVLHNPADVTFSWSDGHLEVTKRLKFSESYVIDVQTSVSLDGKPLHYGVGWRGGFGDVTARRAAMQTQVFNSAAGKINTLTTKNLGMSGQPALRATIPGPFDFVGIEDLYFAAAFLPAAPSPPAPLHPEFTLIGWNFERETTGTDGKIETEAVPEMAASLSVPGSLDFRIYIGPKSIDGLKAVRPPLNGLVQFGWRTFVAEPLLYALRWVQRYVPNYGWAIVLMTIGINMVMFPLKVKSMRAMQKMQKVAPEIKSIQERYKKYSMRDPRKAEMNKEVMAVYSREGINPLGSCWPMLIQMPIWMGLYSMLAYTIELRHAAWVGWIRDLAAPDPYYILPITMGITMYLMQKMTPTPGVDPAQAKMMTLMPIMFAGMFIVFPTPSGLTLYILTSNLIAMAQQWYLTRTMPPPPKPSRGPGKKK